MAIKKEKLDVFNFWYALLHNMAH